MLKREGFRPWELELVKKEQDRILATEPISWEARAVEWSQLERQTQELKRRRETMNASELIAHYQAEPLLSEDEKKIVCCQIQEWGQQPENLIQFSEWAERWDRLVHRVECVIEKRKGEKC